MSTKNTPMGDHYPHIQPTPPAPLEQPTIETHVCDGMKSTVCRNIIRPEDGARAGKAQPTQHGETPRTDAIAHDGGKTALDVINHARQLERELSEAKAEIERLRGEVEWLTAVCQGQLAKLNDIHDLRTQLAAHKAWGEKAREAMLLLRSLHFDTKSDRAGFMLVDDGYLRVYQDASQVLSSHPDAQEGQQT